MPRDIMTGSPVRRRVSPSLPCPKCRKLCPIEARICTCGHWLISPSIVSDEGPVSLSPGLDVVETRGASSRLSSGVSREEKVLSFGDPNIPIERDMDFTAPMPSMPRQMDEFLSLLTGTEPTEVSEVVSSAIPTVPSESEALISNGVSAEPSETGEMLSNSSIAAPSEHDGLLSSPTPTTPRELEDTFTIVKSATPNEKDDGAAGLNPTETRAVGDPVTTSSVTAPIEVEKLFAKFSLPGRGEIYESRATGYKAPWKRNATNIRRIEKYLAIVAVLVFVLSLLAYWMRPFEDVARDPEVTAQDSDESQLGSDLQTTVVEGDPGPKQGEGIEWQSAFQPDSEDRSLNRRMRGPTSENSLPNSAASNPSRLAATRTTGPDQLDSENPLPTRKQGKAEKKKVTVDDLITDKKKITVDDLINDN